MQELSPLRGNLLVDPLLPVRLVRKGLGNRLCLFVQPHVCMVRGTSQRVTTV